MVMLGYALASEEHGPRDLVRYAQMAEEAGFAFAGISDHYHPWLDQQGHSPFVWTVIGGIAQATHRLQLGTGVTCPIVRMHPAIVAQAAATAAAMLDGRFFLGVGTGENLNEHIVGQRWPRPGVRLRMLEEAVRIMRLLWGGGYVSYEGQYFTVDRARIYTLPPEPPRLFMAAAGPRSASLAGRIADGLVCVAPQRELVERFRAAGGEGKPLVGEVTVCWAESEEAARRTAHRWWANTALRGELLQELPTPAQFEQAVAPLREEDVAEHIVCGPDAERHLQRIAEYVEAGFDHIYVHQVGPDQEGFFRFYQRQVLPRLNRLTTR